MSKTEFSSVCPECGAGIIITADIPDNNSNTEKYPIVRGGIKPVESIIKYRFTSEDIANFLIQKARQYVPDIRMKVVPRYCEKKRKSNSDPHRSYASLRIAFSDNVIKKEHDLGWFGSIGENGSNIDLQPGIMKNLIDRYKYNRKDIESWLNNYKTLEELEDTFGMTEAMIRDIKMYAFPRRIEVDKNESWVIFAAATEKVIEDFLTDVNTGELPGKMEIKSIYPISKDIVEFIVYIHPSKMEVRENPHVRQILLGESKPKK